MKIWLVTIGEPLPSDDGAPRLLRHGLLAEALTERGHEVLWWTSSFDHARKRQRETESVTKVIRPGLSLRILRTPGYPSNRSLKRFLDHFVLSRRFAREACRIDPPDLILASYPPVELCWEAVRYGRRRNVPVVLDMRDAWPDIFLEMVPPWVRPAAWLLLQPYFWIAHWTRARGKAILGITPDFVTWGAAVAARRPGPLDRAFPLACSNKPVPPEAREQARKFWDSTGVRDDNDVFTVCFFSSMAPYFELDVVLTAARRLKEKGSRIRFILCGPKDEFARHQVGSTEDRNVVVPGWVGQAEIRELMRRSHVGLAPYRSVWHFRMSIPNKVIEYLSAGLPVVSSLQGSVATLLKEGECGVTYENGDANSLISVLEALESDPDRRSRMAENAARRYRESFDAEVIYAQMTDHLCHVAAGQPHTQDHRQATP